MNNLIELANRYLFGLIKEPFNNLLVIQSRIINIRKTIEVKY